VVAQCVERSRSGELSFANVRLAEVPQVVLLHPTLHGLTRVEGAEQPRRAPGCEFLTTSTAA